MKKRINKPLVSVIMPVYNAENFLVDAIESIMDQTYQKFELIIIDDASTDNSPEIIERFKSKYSGKIKVIKLTTNLNKGGDMCANEGLRLAKGKYIARMDADDISRPERLEKQVEFLEKNKQVFLVGSNARVINKRGKKIGVKIEPQAPADIYHSYFTFHPMIHPSCTFHRILKNGKPFLYKIKYSANNDYLTFFLLLCKGYIFANLNEELVYFRIHGKNDTFINMKEKFFNTLKIRLLMVMKHGYRPSINAVTINIIQALIVTILPENVLLNLYLMGKGIINKNQFRPSLFITQKVKATLTF